MHRRGLNVRKKLLQLILPALRVVPAKTAARLVAGIGRAEYRLYPRLRARFDAAVVRGQNHFGRSWNIPEIGCELAGNQIRWRTRDQLLDGRSDSEVRGLFDLVGEEHLTHALNEKRGVILLGNHFGAHMMPAHWIKRQRLPLRLFMERPHHVSRFLHADFDTEGPLGQKKLFISRKADTSEAAAALMRATRVLKAEMVLYIAGDVRWTGQHALPARFLGRPVSFSSTWAVLAALSNAPVLPVFCPMRADGTHELEFLPAFHVPGDAMRNNALATFVETYVRLIEERVARDPANSNEYFFWSEPDDPALVRGRFDRPAARSFAPKSTVAQPAPIEHRSHTP